MESYLLNTTYDQRHKISLMIFNFFFCRMLRPFSPSVDRVVSADEVNSAFFRALESQLVSIHAFCSLFYFLPVSRLVTEVINRSQMHSYDFGAFVEGLYCILSDLPIIRKNILGIQNPVKVT